MTTTSTIAFLSNPDTPPADRFFVKQGPCNTVAIIRHTYDCFEVVAYGFYGQICRRRMYSIGRNRKSWAIEQAQQWAEKLGLWLDETIYN